MIPSHGATPIGTARFTKKHEKTNHPDKCRNLCGLSVSALALGSYLGNYDDETDQAYEKAVAELFGHGCNFIDTAVNYRCQRSERVIGKALNALFDSKKINRNEVVVSTKGGFIPFDGQPPANMQGAIKKTWVDTGLVSEADIVANCHCMHPAYLQAQIDLSLANLGLQTIDVYYLHNPETQLPIVGEEVFTQRLEKAFALFEENVGQGKIQYYGLATWKAFREPRNLGECILLEKVVALAEKAGGKDHHFRAIQLPYNLAMLEAISVHSHDFGGKQYPIISAAAFYGISVMTSAPLLQSQLIRLPSAVFQKFPGDFTAAQKALQFVVSTPSVTAAMVGMKDPAHLEENTKIMKSKNWDLPTLKKICDVLARK